MEEKFKRQILREFGEFIHSKEAKSIAKQNNKLGGRLRSYTTLYNRDKLTARSALALMFACRVIKSIEFIDFKEK